MLLVYCRLTAAAFAKYEEVKARSTTGLEYALEHRTIMHLDIDVEPMLVVVPEKGIFTKCVCYAIL